MPTIELADLVGDRTEYAVRATKHPGAITPYVFGACWVRQFAESRAREFASGPHGIEAEVVERTVTFGEWNVS